MDKKHIHDLIVFNTISMDEKKKFWDFYYCYIKFSGFREYFDICLYKSGDIDIKVRESCIVAKTDYRIEI